MVALVRLLFFACSFVLREQSLGLVSDKVAKYLKRVLCVDRLFFEELGHLSDSLSDFLRFLSLLLKLTLVNCEFVRGGVELVLSDTDLVLKPLDRDLRLTVLLIVNCGQLEERSQFCNLRYHTAELSDLDLKLANHSFICMDRLVLFEAALRLLRWLVTASDHRLELGELAFTHIDHKLQIRNQLPTRIAVQSRLWLLTLVFVKLKLLLLALEQLFFDREFSLELIKSFVRGRDHLFDPQRLLRRLLAKARLFMLLVEQAGAHDPKLWTRCLLLFSLA